MTRNAAYAPPKRRNVNLTIRSDIMESAKTLHLNASKVAEAAIIEAVRREEGIQWVRETRPAFEAHNKRIAEDGVLLEPDWANKT